MRRVALLTVAFFTLCSHEMFLKLASVPDPDHWYMRTIHGVETSDEDEVDYESNWATLTFGVRSK